MARVSRATQARALRAHLQSDDLFVFEDIWSSGPAALALTRRAQDGWTAGIHFAARSNTRHGQCGALVVLWAGELQIIALAFFEYLVLYCLNELISYHVMHRSSDASTSATKRIDSGQLVSLAVRVDSRLRRMTFQPNIAAFSVHSVCVCCKFDSYRDMTLIEDGLELFLLVNPQNPSQEVGTTYVPAHSRDRRTLLTLDIMATLRDFIDPITSMIVMQLMHTKRSTGIHVDTTLTTHLENVHFFDRSRIVR